MRKITGVLAVVAAVAIGIMAYPEPDPFPAVPLPELGEGPITLRVVRAINPRFNALSDAEITDVLDQTAVMVQDHFGLASPPARRTSACASPPPPTWSTS